MSWPRRRDFLRFRKSHFPLQVQWRKRSDPPAAWASIYSTVCANKEHEHLRLRERHFAPQVGRRKRSDRSRWDWLEKRRAAGGWMVPPERALVPISLYAESLNTNYTS